MTLQPGLAPKCIAELTFVRHFTIDFSLTPWDDATGEKQYAAQHMQMEP